MELSDPAKMKMGGVNMTLGYMGMPADFKYKSVEAIIKNSLVISKFNCSI